MTTTLLDPKMLGFWVRCVRKAQHLSQEALAEAAGITVRTVQRFEAGESVQIGSRRSLAKALGYENVDVFETLEFAESVVKFFKEIEALQQKRIDDQYPDRIRLPAVCVATGEEAIQFIQTVNGVSFDIDSELNAKAKQVAAELGDFLRDLIDLDDLSHTDRLTLAGSLDGLLTRLNAEGASVYAGNRDRKFRGDNWGDQPSMVLNVGHVVMVPASRKIQQMYVLRKARLG